MFEATCNLLIFDKVDKNRNLFPKDMEIKMPEKVPVLSDAGRANRPDCVIGNASVRRNETGLETDVIFTSEKLEDSLKELIHDRKLYISGYYTTVKSHEKDGLRIIDSMRLASTFITFDDVYGNDDLVIRMNELTEVTEDRFE